MKIMAATPPLGDCRHQGIASSPIDCTYRLKVQEYSWEVEPKREVARIAPLSLLDATFRLNWPEVYCSPLTVTEPAGYSSHVGLEVQFPSSKLSLNTG